jgi:AcrR family transcriptional regulator
VVQVDYIQNMNLYSPSETAVPKLRQQLHDATTTGILLAAEEILAEQGVLKTKMQTIAKRAGVAVGTIYNHFPSREALLDALFAMRRRELHAVLDACLKERANEPFARQLHSLVRAVFGQFEEHRAFVGIAIETEHLRAHAPVETSEPEELSSMRQVQAAAEQVVGRGIAWGALKAKGAMLYPLVLTSLIRGVLVEGTQGDEEPYTNRTDAVVDLFLHGAATS